MIYRVVLKSAMGKTYYLVSEDRSVETDANIDLDNIQFLSHLNPTHAHSFSTKEFAEKIQKSLPYPYNEKSSVMKFPSKESPIVHRVYYRIVKQKSNLIFCLNGDKKFTPEITPETLNLYKLYDAKKFFSTLNILDRKLSCIAEVHDFGPPKYEFKNYFITSNEELSEEFQVNVNYS